MSRILTAGWFSCRRCGRAYGATLTLAGSLAANVLFMAWFGWAIWRTRDWYRGWTKP